MWVSVLVAGGKLAVKMCLDVDVVRFPNARDENALELKLDVLFRAGNGAETLTVELVVLTLGTVLGREVVSVENSVEVLNTVVGRVMVVLRLLDSGTGVPVDDADMAMVELQCSVVVTTDT